MSEYSYNEDYGLAALDRLASSQRYVNRTYELRAQVTRDMLAKGAFASLFRTGLSQEFGSFYSLSDEGSVMQMSGDRHAVVDISNQRVIYEGSQEECANYAYDHVSEGAGYAVLAPVFLYTKRECQARVDIKYTKPFEMSTHVGQAVAMNKNTLAPTPPATPQPAPTPKRKYVRRKK